MFGFEGSKASKGYSEAELGDIEESLKGTILEHDAATRSMLEAGFVSPNGKQQDAYEFIEQRKALLESGDLGASAHELTEDAMVQHSKEPEQEHGSISQI